MSSMYKLLGIFYLLIALYIFNAAFDLITMPGFISAMESWIFFIAAILLGISGIKNLIKRTYGSMIGI